MFMFMQTVECRPINTNNYLSNVLYFLQNGKLNFQEKVFLLNYVYVCKSEN